LRPRVAVPIVPRGTFVPMKRLPRTLPPQPGLARRETAAPDRDPPDVLERLLIVDGHEDLSMGALAEGRNYLTSARAIRALEAEAGYENPNGICMLGLAEWLAARVAVIVATVQTIPRSLANPGEMSYATIEGAHQQALAHLDLYRRWAEVCPQVELVSQERELDAVLATWAGDAPIRDRRIGLVRLMENAEPVREPAEIAFWAEQGIRLVGPVWHSNRYGGDTKEGGSLTPLGRQLLVEMGRLGLALDLTHMSEEACLEALDSYEGAVVASHAHSRRTADKPRLLSDRVIEGIVARNGIVGVLPLNWALDSSWRTSDGKEAITLDAVVDAIDHVCEVAGNAGHVGIGSDFDGGQGAESAPAELDTIADLPKLAAALARRGFTGDEVAAVMGGNWLRFLRANLR
jgi:membrane dipeptidase